MIDIKPGNTPLIPLNGAFGVSNLLIKDETYNPTHTFKDRLAFEMLSPIIEKLRNGEPVQQTTFGSISYGNTILSLGYYCQQLNNAVGKEIVSAVGFVPRKLYRKVFGPDTSDAYLDASKLLNLVNKNCKLVNINLEEKIYREKDLEKLARENDACFENFIDVTEGLDRPAYVKIIKEVIESQLKSSPDYVIVPFGAGILCNEIIDYIDDNNLKTKVIPVSSGNPETIATMLYGPIWVDTNSLSSTGKGLTRHDLIDRKGRIRNPYLVYQVYDKEIMCALKTVSALGVSCEPSGASGFAILHRLKNIVPEFDSKRDRVLVINTGNSFLNFNQNPEMPNSSSH
jgi:threonine dehydratase